MLKKSAFRGNKNSQKIKWQTIDDAFLMKD